MARGEGFVSRWARLKREARGSGRAEPSADKPTSEDGAEAVPGVEYPVAATPETLPPEPKPDAEAPAVDPASLPDVESLTYQSDYGAFLQKGVPAELRNQALRRLWRSNPVLANLDGLVEYGEDFSGVGTKKMVVRTAYKVGRGMIDWALEEPEREQEASAPTGDDASPAPTSIEAAHEAEIEPTAPVAKRGKARRAKPRPTSS